jgi:hypothetical protein
MTGRKRTWLVSGIVAGLLILGSAGAALAANSGAGSASQGGATYTSLTGGMMGSGSATPTAVAGGMMGGRGSGGMMGSGSATMMGNCDPSAMMSGAGMPLRS